MAAARPHYAAGRREVAANRWVELAYAMVIWTTLATICLLLS